MILKGYELGAFDCLNKPIRPEVLRAKAAVFVQLQQRTLELREKAEELRVEQNRAHERELQMQRSRFEAEAMKRQMHELAAADRRKDEFLAILAHELRNPLQPLRTVIDLIRQRPDAPLSKPTQETLERRVHHMSRLVDDLLDVARFATGKLLLRNEHVLFGDVVTEALAACHPTLAARGHVVGVTEVSPGTTAIDHVRTFQAEH